VNSDAANSGSSKGIKGEGGDGGDDDCRGHGSGREAPPRSSTSHVRRRAATRAPAPLPLLEEPPSLESSDEEENQDADMGSRSVKPALANVSVWDDDRLRIKALAEADAAELASAEAEAHASPALQEELNAQEDGALQSAPAVASFADPQPGLSGLAGPELDRHIRKLMREGRSLEEVEGLLGTNAHVVQVRGEDLAADAKDRAARRNAQNERIAILSGKSAATPAINERAVTGTMKRKHQLTALVLQAQQAEAGLEEKWSAAKQSRTASHSRFGW